jgi:hypothetical protein
VTVPVTGVEEGPVSVKVVLLIVEEFMARAKVAVTIELEQTPPALMAGVWETTVGGVRPGLAPGLQHPGLRMSNRNATDNFL